MWHSSFKHLGLDSAATPRDVKRAYAARLKEIDAEEDQDAFLKLRSAYESALMLSESGFERRNAELKEGEEREESAAPESDSPNGNTLLSSATQDEEDEQHEQNEQARFYQQIRDLVRPAASAFLESLEAGRQAIRGLAVKVQAESLDYGFAVDRELIDILFEVVRDWENGVSGTKDRFLAMLTACEDFLGWESLAMAPTERQYYINELCRVRVRMLAHSGSAQPRAADGPSRANPAPKSKSSDMGMSWLWIFLFLGLSTFARHCPFNKRSTPPVPQTRPPASAPANPGINPSPQANHAAPQANTPAGMHPDVAVSSAAGMGRPMGAMILYDLSPQVIFVPAGAVSGPLSDDHRIALGLHTGGHLPVQAKQTICHTAQRRIIIVDSANTRELYPGMNIYARLVMQNATTGDAYFLF